VVCKICAKVENFLLSAGQTPAFFVGGGCFFPVKKLKSGGRAFVLFGYLLILHDLTSLLINHFIFFHYGFNG
jgi:hypothetical protein